MKKIIFTILILTLALSMTGCGKRRKKNAASETDASEIEVYSSMDELKDDNYYIYRKGMYYPVYMKNASFETKEDKKKFSSTSEKRSLFFNDDWKKIPTMYQGDMLIYYTSTELSEEFGFERYEDVGYSLGICNLKRLDSGRYAVNVDKEGDKEKKLCIDPDSDANRLFELNQKQIIIDNIGGAQLRSGNISRGGVIIGLKQDQYYSTDVYKGSKLKNYILKADTRILTSMESYKINDYSFLRSKVLKVNIPDYFNSGYYMINGHGVFRYVKVGSSYTAKTDFNIPNEVPEDVEADTQFEEEKVDNANAVIKENFTINEETDVEVTFTFGKTEGNYELADPVVKVIGNESAYTLSEDDENTQKLDAHLKAGQYTLEISGLNGRTYEYKVTKKAGRKKNDGLE